MNPADPTGVPAAFDAAAHAYDRLVGANPGYHSHLRRSAARMRLPDDGAGLHLLDLGCGTGASTAALLSVAPAARITAVDASAGMLARARAKSWPESVRFRHADADELASAEIGGPFDGIFAAYLLRNVSDPDACLATLRGSLRLGGTLVVHEYSVRGNPIARAVWEAVCASVIIPMGRVVGGDAALYRYLRRSVNAFDSVPEFRERLCAAGFTGVHSETMPGWQHGIVHTFVAHAPSPSPRHDASDVDMCTGSSLDELPVHMSTSDRPTGARDRKLVRHLAPSGLPSAASLGETPRVAVVGGGIAGLAAATGLAERGVDVRLLESQDHLGGRVGGWPEQLADDTAVTMSRGFHAFFRQYYNLRALLRRTDPPLDRLTALPDYPLVDSAGRTDSFRWLPRTPPWNALAFVARSPTFGWRDMLRLNPRAALPLGTVSVPETYAELDHLDAAEFLRRINFPAAARHLAFEVFSRSFFAAPEEISAAELATMFHLYFLGSSEGLLFDVPADTFPASLWSPLADYLAAQGAEIHTGTPVTAVEPGGARTLRVHTPCDRPLDVDGVVLAPDVGGLRDLVARSPGLGTEQWRSAVAGLRVAPPFLVRRLWLDTPVAAQRPAFLGTAGFGELDNISVLDRYEAEAASWARRTGGSVVELHAYAVSGDASDETGVPALRKRLLAQLHRVYPETADAGIVGEFTEWRQDSPLFGVGDFARRPGVRTSQPGLVLAGDGIRIDLPVALMERAASTGWHAANCLLARFGLAGHELHTVPTAGRIAALRALRRR